MSESQVVYFGAEPSPSVAEYCLLRTGIEFASGQHEILKAIEEDTYVDDIITGSDCETNAVQIGEGLTKVLKKEALNLRTGLRIQNMCATIFLEKHVAN